MSRFLFFPELDVGMGVELGAVGVGVEVEDEGSIGDVDVISGAELGVGGREELDVVEVGVASGIVEVVDGVKVLVVSGVGLLFTEDDDMVDDFSTLEEVCTKDDDDNSSASHLLPFSLPRKARVL